MQDVPSRASNGASRCGSLPSIAAISFWQSGAAAVHWLVNETYQAVRHVRVMFATDQSGHTIPPVRSWPLALTNVCFEEKNRYDAGVTPFPLMTQSGLRRMSRLPRWRNKWVGFYCAAIFRQTLIQSVEGRATLIQRDSDCCSGTLDDKCTGCTKSFFKFCVRERHGNRLVSAATSVFQLAAPAFIRTG